MMQKIRNWDELSALPDNDEYSVKVPPEYGATAWIYSHNDGEWPVDYIDSHAFDTQTSREFHSEKLQRHGFDVEFVLYKPVKRAKNEF